MTNKEIADQLIKEFGATQVILFGRMYSRHLQLSVPPEEKPLETQERLYDITWWEDFTKNLLSEHLTEKT